MHYSKLAVLGVWGLVHVVTGVHAQTSPAHDWSGGYFGGSVGGTEGVSPTAASTSAGFGGSYFTAGDPEQVAGAGDGEVSEWNPSGGLFGGYGHQFSNLYVGFEGGANSLSFDDSRSSTVTYTSAPASQFTLRQTVKADWQATLRARLGWAQDRWLGYVTAGGAVTEVRVNTSFTDNFMRGAGAQDSSGEAKAGWVIGGGIEYALSDNWFLRMEYLYADYGKVNTFAVITNPSFPALANSLQDKIDFRTQTVSVGIAYRF